MDERSDQEDQTCGEWKGEEILENFRNNGSMKIETEERN